MDKATARRIARDTFKAPLNQGRYRNFINELLRDFVGYKPKLKRGDGDEFLIPKPDFPSTFRHDLHPDLRASFVLANGSMPSLVLVN